jgi:hypothetical protein
MTTVTAQPCRVCRAKIRRSTGLKLCKPCLKVADQVFRREHPYTNGDQWVRDLNRFYGNAERVIAAVRAERGVLVGT